jgi:hypothetical protein
LTSYIFQQLSERGRAEGINETTRRRDARKWFQNAAQKVSRVNKNMMLGDSDNLVDSIDVESIGKMYMFSYDPKYKETLPYYDMFPLVFPIDLRKDGFLGINLHYLPPVLRAKLMNAIYQTINNDAYNQTTKLKISYSILSNTSKYRYFKPCIKQYLATHVQSSYLNIEPTNWDSALMLPTEQFKKATKEQVWKDSRGMV